MTQQWRLVNGKELYDMPADPGQQVLELERRQRLIGAAVIISAFVLLFLLLSSRISRLLKRVSSLSRRPLDMPEEGIDRHGNQLLILEDWIRDFVQLVMRGGTVRIGG